MSKIIVGDAMKTLFPTCLVTATIPSALAAMTEYAVRAIVVVDEEGLLTGIFSQTDALRAWGSSPNHRAYMESHVGSYMTPKVLTCPRDTPLQTAARLLTDRRLHRLIVVRKQNQGRSLPVGMLSQNDILRATIYLVSDD